MAPTKGVVACERCRNQKVRCEWADEEAPERGERCRMCAKRDHECHVAKRSRRETSDHRPSKKTRLEALEERLNKVCELLPNGASGQQQNQTQNQSTPPDSNFSEPSPASNCAVAPPPRGPITSGFAQETVHNNTVLNSQERYTGDLANLPRNSSNPVHAALGAMLRSNATPMGGLKHFENITLIDVKHGLSHFQAMWDRFPFVFVRSGTTAEELLATRPLFVGALKLLSADLLVEERVKMSTALRQTLTQQAMCGDLPTLDLLQSLLLCAAYFHHNWSGDSDTYHYQIFFCLGLASDLLHKGELQMRRDANADHDTSGHRNLQRTYLGCQYMETSLKLLGCGRPHKTIDWDDSQAIAKELATKADYPSDVALPQLVQLWSLVDDVACYLRPGQQRGSVDQMLLPQFAKRLESLSALCDAAASSSIFFDQVDVLRCFLGEIGLRAARATAFGNAFAAAELMPGTIRQLDGYLTQVRSSGVPSMGKFSTVQWSNLLSVIMIFDRLARSLPLAYSCRADGVVVRDQFIAHLEIFAAHGSPTDIEPRSDACQASEGLFDWFARLCRNLKTRQLQNSHNQGSNGAEETSMESVKDAENMWKLTKGEKRHAEQQPTSGPHSSGNTFPPMLYSFAGGSSDWNFDIPDFKFDTSAMMPFEWDDLFGRDFMFNT